MVLEGKRAFVSWSGGKDSVLSFHRARSRGLHLSSLLNMLDEEGRRSHSHGLPPGFIAAQARSLGTELVQPRASWEDYEREFDRRTFNDLMRSGRDASGERGEYHTAVLSGPGFSFPLEIVDARERLSPGRACLEIIEWRKGA